MSNVDHISLSNVIIKISNVSIDNINQNINFSVQSASTPSLQTNVYGSATLSECLNLSQGDIVSLIWNRASNQCANWLLYVNRTDINLPALNGTTFTPSNQFISVPMGGSSNVFIP